MFNKGVVVANFEDDKKKSEILIRLKVKRDYLSFKFNKKEGYAKLFNNGCDWKIRSGSGLVKSYAPCLKSGLRKLVGLSNLEINSGVLLIGRKYPLSFELILIPNGLILIGEMTDIQDEQRQMVSYGIIWQEGTFIVAKENGIWQPQRHDQLIIGEYSNYFDALKKVQKNFFAMYHSKVENYRKVNLVN